MRPFVRLAFDEQEFGLAAELCPVVGVEGADMVFGLGEDQQFGGLPEVGVANLRKGEGWSS